jgi:hypothetical protein
MRVIFSRKGFDSSAGGCASPIIDGAPLTLPIPAADRSVTRYGDLGHGLTQLVRDLSGGRLGHDSLCHLDPDLHPDTLRRGRVRQWRGTLGQEGAAQGHLSNQGVGAGDLFLFFGLFRPVERDLESRWRYCGSAQHLIFGWLQIEEEIPLGPDGRWIGSERPWLVDHPHARAGYSRNNSVYVAMSRLRLPGLTRKVPGFGWFSRGLRLTDADADRVSDWRVPAWLDPTQGGVGMTYHPPSRWRGDGRVRAAGRGQEFVSDVGTRRDASDWLVQCFSPARASTARC